MFIRRALNYIGFTRQTIPRTLKFVGTGLVEAGLLNNIIFKDGFALFNMGTIGVGFVSTVLGSIIEYCQASRNERCRCNSTQVIIECLGHAAGLGATTAAIHTYKGVDRPSANLGNFLNAVVLLGAMDEVESSAELPIGHLPREKTRILIALIANYLMSSAAKPLVNGEEITFETKAIMVPVGLFLTICEFIYSKCYDKTALNFKNALRRRSFTLSIPLNVIFAINDIFFTQRIDEYNNFDNSYAGIVVVLLFATLAQLRRLAVHNKGIDPILEGKVAKSPQELLQDAKEFNEKGLRLLAESKFQESIEPFVNAAMLFESIRPESDAPDYKEHSLELAGMYYHLGLAYRKSGDLEQAKSSLGEALKIRTCFLSLDPEDELITEVNREIAACNPPPKETDQTHLLQSSSPRAAMV